MALGLKDVLLVTELVKGLAVTLRHFFKPVVTLQYPTERREPFERFRGLLRWNQEKCAACVLCVHYCPVNAITMVTGEAADGHKEVRHYALDAARCMTCGLCVEICPVGALAHSPYYELAAYERQDVIFNGPGLAGEPPITRYQ